MSRGLGLKNRANHQRGVEGVQLKWNGPLPLPLPSSDRLLSRLLSCVVPPSPSPSSAGPSPREETQEDGHVYGGMLAHVVPPLASLPCVKKE